MRLYSFGGELRYQREIRISRKKLSLLSLSIIVLINKHNKSCVKSIRARVKVVCYMQVKYISINNFPACNLKIDGW
jgi:hypothetical protein